MKRTFLIATYLLLAGSTLSMTQAPYSEILTEEDYQMQSQAFATHTPEMTVFEGEKPYWDVVTGKNLLNGDEDAPAETNAPELDEK